MLDIPALMLVLGEHSFPHELYTWCTTVLSNASKLDKQYMHVPSSARTAPVVASSMCPFLVINVPTGFPRTMSRIVSPCLIPLAMTTAVSPSTAFTADFNCVCVGVGGGGGGIQFDNRDCSKS